MKHNEHVIKRIRWQHYLAHTQKRFLAMLVLATEERIERGLNDD